MSDVITAAVAALSEKLSGGLVGGTAKFVIEGEGALIIDTAGVHAGDEEADVVLTASAETFEGIMTGAIDPTAAYMSQKLAIDGNIGLAMQLGALLG